MSQLTTDWIRVATEGETFRNVPIQRQWLIDIADSYEPLKYGARIWPDHRRWYGAWGDVVAVKREEHDKKLVLFAKLCPNQQLIAANEMDQKVYSSIEIEPNFAGTGKAYLTGLGVTDEPASLGTDRLKFSADSQQIYSAPQPLSLRYHSDVNEPSSALMQLFEKFFSQSQPPVEDKPPMEQLTTLIEKVDAIATHLTELDSKVEQFSVQPTPPQGDATDSDDASDSAQFAQLTEQVSALATQLGELNQKFSTLQQEQPNQLPTPEGNGDFVTLV